MSQMSDTIKKLSVEYESKNGDDTIIIPYEKFNLTQPRDKNEVALTLNNIIIAYTTRKNEQGKVIDQMGEIYSQNNIKIGETVEDGQIKCDLEIITSLIENQQRKLNELIGDFTVAGADTLDNQGRIESFIELVNREIVTMNKEQKEKYDSFKADYERGINDISRESVEGRRNKKDELDKKIENMDIVKNKENAELVKSMAEQDLGFEISKIVPIEDSLFYDNNPDVVRGKAYFSVDTQGRPQIIYSNNGKFEKANGFRDSQNKSSRLAIMTSDDQNIEEKNIYGSLKSERNGVSYAFAYGDYGVPELIEVRPNPNGGLSEVEKGIGRKVQLNNTSYNDINREGNTRDNITRETFKIGHGYSSDGHPISGISRKMQQINDDRNQDGNIEDISPEDLAQNINLRIESAFVRVEQKLKESGIDLDSEEENNIRNELKESMEKDNIVFDDEAVDSYCQKYIKIKEAKEKVEQNKPEKEEDVEEYEGPTLYNTHRRSWM